MASLQPDEGLSKGPTATRHGSTAGANWLQPERFEDPNFSAEACIADFRRYVPLATIKAELQACISNVKTKLVEVLNEDYGEYVSLSSRLANVDGAVVRMRQPLLDTQAQLAQVQQSLKDELSALQQGLQRRQEVAAARSTLELLQEVAHVTSKVEKLLQEVAATTASSSSSAAGPTDNGHSAGSRRDGGQDSSSGSAGAAAGAAAGAGGGGVDMDARSRLLERVAAEMSRLVYLRNKGQDDLAFLQTLDKRIASCKTQLDRALQHLLLESLAARQWGPAGHCLHGYVELGEAGRGEEALRSGLVRPIVTQLVAQVKEAAAARGGRDELAPLVPLLLPRLSEEAQPLLELLLAPASGLALFDVLGNVVLQELVEALSTSMPGVFAPGVPAAFHANYQAGVQLLQQVESLARTRRAIDQLRASSAAASWAKRWNLAVYFSLRYQDIAGNLEEAATAGKLQPALKAAPGSSSSSSSSSIPWRLQPSHVLWASLNQCIDPQVFLAPLADRFLKLALQLLSRYQGWLAAIVTARQEAAAAAAAGAAAAGAAAAGSAAAAADGAASAAGGEGGEGPQAQAGPAGWAGSTTQEDLVAVACDAQQLQHEVLGAFLPALLKALQGVPAEVQQAVQEAVAGLAKGIGDRALQVLLLLGEEVVERCVAVVKQLKGITATYRMTSKGPPVRHSHYVSGVLAPLRQLLDAPGAMQQLPPQLKQQLAGAVVDSVNTRYQALAEELLVTVRKTESSLKRLKKVRPGESEADGGAGGAGMSDSDKITLQLHLDVQEHGRQIEGFGLAPQGMPSYGSLLAVVTLPAAAPQQQ